MASVLQCGSKSLDHHWTQTTFVTFILFWIRIQNKMKVTNVVCLRQCKIEWQLSLHQSPLIRFIMFHQCHSAHRATSVLQWLRSVALTSALSHGISTARRSSIKVILQVIFSSSCFCLPVAGCQDIAILSIRRLGRHKICPVKLKWHLVMVEERGCT